MKRTRFEVPADQPPSPTTPSSPARSKEEAQSPSSRGLLPAVLQCWNDILSGLRDAVALITAVDPFRQSTKMLMRAAFCFLLNGVIFGGSIFTFNVAVVPLTRWLWSLPTGGDPPRIGELFELILHVVYYIGWVYPVYAFSFLLNGWWHQEIADLAYKLRHEGAPANVSATYVHFRQRVADEIFRAVMILFYLSLAAAVRFVPLVGTPASFILLSWVYAFYSFEYIWINRGWTLAQRVGFFETHWAYFFGFGLPCTLLTFFSSHLVSGVVFAMIFPLFIVMANAATVRPVAQPNAQLPSRILDSVLPTRMPVFSLPWRTTSFFVRRIQAIWASPAARQ